MRAPISVVVATRDAAAVLPFQLAALGEGLAEGLIRDLIVVDGGSTDATLQIAADAGAQVVPGPADRAQALAQGVQAAGGEWVLIATRFSVPVPGWTGQVLRHLERAAGQPGRVLARHCAERGWRKLWPAEAWPLLPQGAAYVAVAPSVRNWRR
jgi:glycosyltransferase involved in cell wall biosynthesis